MYGHVHVHVLTLAGGAGLPHVQLYVMADVGEEVIVSVKMGDDLTAIVKLVLAVMTVHINHWRLQGVRSTCSSQCARVGKVL